MLSSWQWVHEGWDFLRDHLGKWDAWVAIGTLLLASGTFFMAWGTNRLARLTARQVDAVEGQAAAARDDVRVSQDAFLSSVRPILVDVPRATTPRRERVFYADESYEIERSTIHVEETPDYLYCSVPLRNAGPGLALMEDVGLRWAATDSPWQGDPSLRAVASGDQTRVRFSIPKRRPEFGPARSAITEAGSFTVEAHYADVAGRPQPFTRLELSRNDEGEWETSRIILLERPPHIGIVAT